MKKIIPTVLVLIILGLLSAPRLVGNGIHSATVEALVEMVPADARAVLDVRPTEFRRGWFSSEARVQVRLPELDKLTGNPASLLLDMDIRHGPLLFTPDGIRLGLAYADIHPALQGINLATIEPDGEIDASEPQFNLFAGFDNAVVLNFGLDSLVASNPEARIEVGNLRGKSQVNADLSGQMEVDLDTSSFSAPDSTFDLSIQNLHASGWEANVSRPLSPGRSSFSLNRASSTAPLPLSLSRLSADYQLDYDEQDPGSLGFSQDFRIESLEWDLPVNSLRWQFQVQQLSRELLNSYVQLVQQSGRSSSQAASAQLAVLGQEFALRLAQENFQFHNDLQLDAFAGSHSLVITLNWLGLPALTSLDSIDPRQALDALEISLSFDGDEAALMNSPFAQTVTGYRGLLVIENGRIKIDARLGNGELNINGDIVPLEQFVNFR